MNVIISCHFDTIFLDPFAVVKNGTLYGTCDNLAGILATAQLIGKEGMFIEYTNCEESTMGGAQ